MSKNLEEIERADMVESLVIDLVEWAMSRDPQFREELANHLNDWLEQTEKDAKNKPGDPRPPTQAKLARTFLEMLGLPIKNPE